MAYVPPIETVRAQVRSQFSELGASGDPPRETILIRHGHYCGRRFRLESWEAVWFVEEGQIKFYQAGSGLCRVLELIDASSAESEIAAPVAEAAVPAPEVAVPEASQPEILPMSAATSASAESARILKLPAPQALLRLELKPREAA